MSIECGECERDLRGGHDASCSRYDPAMEACVCDPEWEPDCPVHGRCHVFLLDDPPRAEFPWRVKCPRCGWVDTFRDEAEARSCAVRHDRDTR